MRIPPLAVALTAAAALGGTAAVATAQDVPPFEPEPTTTTTPTTTEPVPPADSSAPVITVKLPKVPTKAPKVRIGKTITRVPITFSEPDSALAYAQVDVKRRIRLRSGVRDQAYDGRRWRTTTSATKYRIFPKVSGTKTTYTLKLTKGLPAARYWITVKAQNDPGTSRTKKVSFRTR